LSRVVSGRRSRKHRDAVQGSSACVMLDDALLGIVSSDCYDAPTTAWAVDVMMFLITGYTILALYHNNYAL